MLDTNLLQEKVSEILITQESEAVYPDNEELFWNHALSWVAMHTGRIAWRARKFIPYSPYTKDDFIQQSYIAAYGAIKKSMKRGEPERFESYFWVELKSQYSRMATDPSKRTILGGDASLSPCIREEYREDGNNEKPATRQSTKIHTPQKLIETENIEDEVVRNSSIRKALSVMTIRQRQVWEFLLGYHGQIPTTREIGRRIGITRQRVEKLRDKGLRRVEIYFSREEGRNVRERVTIRKKLAMNI